MLCFRFFTLTFGAITDDRAVSHNTRRPKFNNNNNNGYSALGSVWQEPEPSQATGMALVRCILGKFFGVVCHCFPSLCAKKFLVLISFRGWVDPRANGCAQKEWVTRKFPSALSGFEPGTSTWSNKDNLYEINLLSHCPYVTLMLTEC
jgi:hypothetical protein